MPTCPVCGYPDLEESPRASSGGGSYEICPSCGFQFGVDDDDKGITHDEWRARWKEKGHVWSSRGIAPPEGWNAAAQLASVTGGASPKPNAARGPASKKKRASPKVPAKKGSAGPTRKKRPRAKAVKKSARKKR